MRGALIGKKLGMTSLFTDDGRQLPCTVIEAGPCSVVQVKAKDIDGYSAVQLGYGEIAERHLNKPLKGHFDNAGVEPKRYLKEFRNPESEYEVGEKLTVEQFAAGDKVRISGKSIGRGFQGVVKRHHFGGVGMMSHGQSDRQRHGGSVGQSSYPSKIMKGIKMPGRMGGKRISVRNLEVVEVIPDQNLILIKGSVPGPKNQLLELVKQ
jgi:large subunit ribosomal protein L3